MYTISPQLAKHAPPIETLLDKAFGKDRRNKRSYHFRAGIKDIKDLRFVAHTHSELVGTIRFWPVDIAVSFDNSDIDTTSQALLLGPLGVSPELQGRGIGAALIEHGIHAARTQGFKIVILVGDLNYYGRFGFGPATDLQHHITMPGEQDHRVLVRELQNGALEGMRGIILPASTH